MTNFLTILKIPGKLMTLDTLMTSKLATLLTSIDSLNANLDTMITKYDQTCHTVDKH